MDKIDRWKGELARIAVVWRWGDTRRFRSNKRKVERISWLVDHIAEAEAKRAKKYLKNKTS